MQMNDLQKELDRTKAELMRTKGAVFFTTIIFSLKFRWDEKHPTAYTDGHVIGFNPKFFLSMPRTQRVGVMVHEGAHVAYDHMGRLLGRDMLQWNKAADHVINLHLLANDFELPAFRLADSRFEGMSTEQVYNVLVAEQDQTPNEMPDIRKPGECKGEGTGTETRPAITEAEHKRHIEDILIRASVQAKMQGEAAGAIPGEVELFLQKLLKPRLPWKQILRREVGQMARNGYTWMKPNRRYFPQYYLPAPWSTAPAEMTFYVDISASVSQHQFTVFVSEIVGALKAFNLRKIRIVQFDTRIKHDDTVRSLSELSKVKFTGRGGTIITAVLDDIEKTHPPLAAIFSDGEFRMDRPRLKGRVLWLINDNESFTAPFGRVLHFKTR